jgi:predicted RNA-binding Zn-ribbon protein involved in translation (DUF1610 family)
MMFTGNFDMSSTISLPTCSCCHRHIMPNDKCVKFNCPSCGTDLIWRCQSCRDVKVAEKQQETTLVLHVIFRGLKK